MSDVFVSREGASQLRLTDGRPSPVGGGRIPGVCRIAEFAPGTLQAYWPEAGVLLPRRVDPGSKEPDYNVPAWVEPAGE
jgi:hypothetical protein